MACHVFGAKPSSKPMLAYFYLYYWEQISVKFYSKYKNFIQQKAVENIVSKMAPILS